MYQQIQLKALIAKNGQEVAVRNLTTAILAEFDRSNTFPAGVKNNITNRLTRAELSFRRNGQRISEYKIVEMIDYLANTFSAPEYARTSPLQVRFLRVGLTQEISNLINSNDTNNQKGLLRKNKSELSDKLLPLEATCIAMEIIRQKMINPRYQKTSNEWAADLNSLYAEFDNATQPALSGSSAPRPKVVEMQGLVQGLTLTESQIQLIADNSLDVLGIPR